MDDCETYRGSTVDGESVMRCPECGKECGWDGNPFRPFCSERCRLLDLLRWLNEEYTLVEEAEGGEGEVDSGSEAVP